MLLTARMAAQAVFSPFNQQAAAAAVRQDGMEALAAAAACETLLEARLQGQAWEMTGEIQAQEHLHQHKAAAAAAAQIHLAEMAHLQRLGQADQAWPRLYLASHFFTLVVAVAAAELTRPLPLHWVA